MVITKSEPYTKEEITKLIESLSMDLLRAALGRHRGSLSMAKKFENERLCKEVGNWNQQTLKTAILKY